MNRRSFFGSLFAAAATAVLDPEKLLWVPGQKTIFIPPMVVELCYDDITAVVLKVMRKEVVFENFFLESPFLEKLRSVHA